MLPSSLTKTVAAGSPFLKCIAPESPDRCVVSAPASIRMNDRWIHTVDSGISLKALPLTSLKYTYTIPAAAASAHITMNTGE